MDPLILLVDDDAVQASIRSAILCRTGLGIEVAHSAQQALALLDRIDVRRRLRLLITDHLMPGMNGPELVRGVRAVLPDLPVLVLSGLNGAESEYEPMPICFQLKPFPPAELICMVHALLGLPMLRSA